uniref:Uncharacterized protein n=1 Tax=Phlebotomus papatasi TaxID=29031 RepID=A0A1B0CYM2_PHLPP
MRCNGLPNSQNPGDLRQYIHMWMEKEESITNTERNWLLMTNEESVLTQNRDVMDLTRANVKKSQPNIGDVYSNRVKEVLGIMNELNEAIVDASNLTPVVYRDLLRLRTEMREKLTDYIDKFSYQILCNIDRDMNLEGSTTIATHTYASSVFKSQLWTLRDIPQPQLSAKDRVREGTKHTEVEFSLLDTTIILPPTIKCFRAALRGLCLNYDHFSDSCYSFSMPKSTKKTTNLRQSTKIEWLKRKELLEKALIEKNFQKNDMVEFDITPAATTVIDVDKLYSDYETEQNRQEKRHKGPEGLKLIFYPNKLKRKHFYQSYKPPPPPQPGVRRLPEEIEAEIKLMEENLDKLALITVKLPENVLWFEPPIVCRWESPDDIDVSLEDNNDESGNIFQNLDTNPHPKQHGSKPDSTVIEIPDFNLLCIPSYIDLHALMLDFIVPRLPDGYGVMIENMSGERKSSLMKYVIKESEIKRNIEFHQKNSPVIETAIHSTNSPRSLHPKVRFKKVLRILSRKRSKTTIASESSSSTDEEESEVVQKFRRSSISMEPSGGKYFLSQFIRDLDELTELQHPQFDEKIEEIASKTLLPQEEISDTVRKTSSVSLLREHHDLLCDMRFLGASMKCHDTSNEIDHKVEIVEESNSESDSDDNIDLNASYTQDNSFSKWSTRDVHDVKFNEDKLTIQFRTGRLGCFGFAANRYSNLPYQTWELKPDFRFPNAVSFTLTAAVVSIDITILDNGVRLNSIQGCSSAPLAHILGIILPLDELKTVMKSTAVDLFPESDAFCYTEGSCEKNSVMEEHLYDCMGSLALTHNFSWSRWNLLSGSRSAVLLMREVMEYRKPPSQSTLLVTPLKTIVVDCTEVSASFSTVGVPGMQFYADLHHLAREHSQPVSREKQRNMNLILRDNVVQVLKSTRPLSFC